MIESAITIHQNGALGMIGGPMKLNEALPSYHAFMNDYGTAFRTFKHGALHGAISGLFFAFSNYCHKWFIRKKILEIYSCQFWFLGSNLNHNRIHNLWMGLI